LFASHPQTGHGARIASSSRGAAARLAVSQYLDYQSLRRLADRTLENYAYALLHFLRWWESIHHTDAIAKEALTESTLLNYVRFQSSQQPEVTGGTINQRVATVDHALRIVFSDAPGQIAPGFQQTYWQRAPMGFGRPRLALSRLRVKTPKRTISPLSVDEVARFWSRFRTSRDLAIVGLMLLQGLRSQEVLDLNRDDLLLAETQVRVRGKGNKTRFLPLAPEAAQLLDHYLRLERPTTSANALFVSLKGPARGARMTLAGLRSLFPTIAAPLASRQPTRTVSATPSPRIWSVPALASPP
jgi:integrase